MRISSPRIDGTPTWSATPPCTIGCWPLGVTAASAAALGDLDGRSVAVEGALDALPALTAAFEAVGARIAATDIDTSIDDVLATEADVLVCGSKVGLVDHERAALLAQRVVVPLGAVPVTARGLAVARRRDIVVLPDFLTTAGPLLAFRAAVGTDHDELVTTAGARIGALAADLVTHDDGPLLAGCYRAEAFLSTWRDELPFGRPLA